MLSKAWLALLRRLTVPELARLRHAFESHDFSEDDEYLHAIDEEFRHREEQPYRLPAQQRATRELPMRRTHDHASEPLR